MSYVHVLDSNGTVVGYFQIDSPPRFLYTNMQNGQSAMGMLTNQIFGGKVGARATAQNFSAWLVGFRFPLPEGEMINVEIEGQIYSGIAHEYPPNQQAGPTKNTPSPKCQGRPAPDSARIVCIFVAENVVTIVILQSPTTQLHFKLESDFSRKKRGPFDKQQFTEGTLDFDGISWKFVGTNSDGSPFTAELLGVDADFKDIGQPKMKFKNGKESPVIRQGDPPKPLIRQGDPPSVILVPVSRPDE